MNFSFGQLSSLAFPVAVFDFRKWILGSTREKKEEVRIKLALLLSFENGMFKHF
jgi:hypothetical protein